MKTKIKFMAIIGVVIGIVIVFSSITSAFSTPLFQPVIVVFGNSPEVQSAMNTLVEDYPNAKIISYTDIHSVGTALTLIRSYSPLILVGHGSQEGLLGPTGNIITWKNIGAWINTLPTSYVFFLACDSSSAAKYVNVHSIGFSGSIDSILGATAIAIALQRALGNTVAVNRLQSQFTNRMISLQIGKVKPMNLLVNNFYIKVFEDDYQEAETVANQDYQIYEEDEVNWKDVILITNLECSMNCDAFQLYGTGIGINAGLSLEGHYWVFDDNNNNFGNAIIIASVSGYLLGPYTNPKSHFEEINFGAQNIAGGSCGWDPAGMWNCIESVAQSISPTGWAIIAILIAITVIAILYANSPDTLGASAVVATALAVIVVAFIVDPTTPVNASNVYNNGYTLSGLNNVNTQLGNLVPPPPPPSGGGGGGTKYQ